MVLTKAQAKSLDILEVARSLGMEMKRKSHREYYWAEHDSFKIDTVKNTWRWYSQADKYGDTIQLVQEMRNVSYKDAVVFLETGSFPEAKPVEEERKPFNYTLAPYEQPFVEARSYLKEIRGLSDDTIDFFLEKGVLAQAKRKDKDGVIEDVLVFKYLDRNQQLVGASLQGLVPDQERHPGKGYLKQIMYQSESISGLNVSIGSPKRLIVTEAPIDLMSYYELHKGELNDVRLVAMEGLKEGVLSHYVLEMLQERGDIPMDERDYTKSSELARTSKFLSVAAETSTLFQDHKYDELITLAVDRDKAGTDFITKLREKKIPVVDARPPKREGQEKTDWNEILKQEKQLEKDAPDNSRLAQARRKLERLRGEQDEAISRAYSHQAQTNGQPMNDKRGGASFMRKQEQIEGQVFSKMDEIRKQEERVERLEHQQHLKEMGLNRQGSGLEMSVQNIPRIREELEKAKRGESFFTKATLKRYQEELTRLEAISEQMGKTSIQPATQALIDEGLVNQWQKQPNTYFVKGLRRVALELTEEGEFQLSSQTKYHPKTDEERLKVDELLAKQRQENIQLGSVESEEKEKSLESIQETANNSEQNKKVETKLGDFPEETQGAAPLPEANVSQPLNDLSPSQTRSQPLLHFSINEDRKSIHKDNYHPISDKDLLKLNRYAYHLQNASQWYLENVADSQVIYFYQDGADTNSVAISYSKESFMHLTGIFPYREGQTAGQTLLDFAAGNGQFDNILIANRGAAFDKLKVLPELPAIVDAESFYFGDLSDVEKFHSLNLDKAIRSNDQDVLLAFRTVDGTVLPASLMRLRKSLNLLLDQTNQEKIILGVFRERDGHIEQLSINEEYVKDKGAEMLSVLKNKQYEEVSKEIEQTTPESTLNTPLLDSTTFTQVLDTVYNLGVPADISKTPEEFHQAWNQYLDYAKQYNDKFDQIVAAAGEDHLLDTNSDFYKEWKQDHIYKENYHVRLQWSEERPDGPRLPFKETELISYQEFARELYKANQDFYQLHQEGLEQVAGGHPEAYITPTKIQFSIYAPDGELIQDSIRYNIGEEINPIAHKERLGTREMREYPELMKIDGAIFTPYHLERLASELDISQFSYALEDTLYADQLLSQLPFGDLENSPIGFTDSSHDGRLGFISFDGMDSVEVENLSAWFEKLGVKDSPMEQLALIEKWQKEIKGLSEKVEQTISTVREEFEKSQEEEIKLEEQSYNKQELEHDADADGVSDEEELLQGTNPYDFRSKPGSKPEVEEGLQAEEVVLAAGSLAVADFIQNKDMAGLSRHLKEGIKEFLDSDKYRDYLTKMSQLNNYSNRNLRLILAQNPEARQVASFKQWKENFGRYVKKGEKALRIFKPMTKIKKDENNQPILDKNGKPETVTFFGLVPVFDVSQTEGKEMPKAAEVKEQLTDLDYANLYRALMAIAKENDVSVRFEEMENNKHGYYSVPENQIVLRSNEMNKAQIIKTFLHEMAHAELHHADNPQKENLTRSTAELQAESVAYVVSSYYGIDTSEYSFNYLSGWSADKETLADLEAQLDIVQQEAKSLMVRMDQALEQLRLSQEKQTKLGFEQKLEKFKDQSKQAVEEHKQELKADAQSKKEKGFSK
ncbi:PBECR4 domain-containing protein [Streptococcus oralis]|uniref:Toprim domain-containing protein n=1 Tax=Streptococcus oralis subsp. oralis TaxID=1891914 RepID=A0A7H9FHL4_STROR|nr:PBECR4 domain-containing protein [Streptococcus oralis]QLL98089.1 toprim domain-containing protein [Streptococcus oralis subsp. oralis]